MREANRQVFELVAEPLVAYGVGSPEERGRRVREVLDTVGLEPDVYGRRRPRQLSGGQAQRVAIARALTLDVACHFPVERNGARAS